MAKPAVNPNQLYADLIDLRGRVERLERQGNRLAEEHISDAYHIGECSRLIGGLVAIIERVTESTAMSPTLRAEIEKSIQAIKARHS